MKLQSIVLVSALTIACMPSAQADDTAAEAASDPVQSFLESARWSVLEGGFGDKTRNASWACYPSTGSLPGCLTVMPPEARREIANNLWLHVGAKLVPSGFPGVLGGALLSGQSKRSLVKTMEMSKLFNYHLQVLMSVGDKEKSEKLAGALAAFLNSPLDSSATVPLLHRILRTNMVLSLLKGAYVSAFCVPEEMQSKEVAAAVWARLSAISTPDFDPEGALLGEYRQMIGLVESDRQILAGYLEQPGSSKEILAELAKLRAAAAETPGSFDPAHLSRTFALGIRHVFARLVEAARLPLSEAREECRRLEEEVGPACWNSGKGEMAWRLLKSIYSGRKATESGSFTQFGIDVVWERSRCLVLLDPISAWERQVDNIAEARAYKTLALARLAGEQATEQFSPGPDGNPGTEDDIPISDPCPAQK